MKKSELTQLTQIIEHLVAKEIRKQLPTIIAETFQNMMGKPVVNEQRQPVQSIREQIEPTISEDPVDFKASLRDLFAGTPVMKSKNESGPKLVKQYTRDPKINQILNETVSDLRDREILVGAAAFQGGYSPSLALVPGFNPSAISAQPMESVEEPSFSKNMPTMPGVTPGMIPMARPPVLVEGQESNHAPMTSIPEGVSVLDVKEYVPPVVASALTKNYSQMMKLIDKKRGKV
jgi:hypothetical protein